MENLGTVSQSKQPLHLNETEHAILSNEATNAKAAMGQTLHDMNESLKRVFGVATFARRHPWYLAGSAVVVGCVTGMVLTRTRRTKSTELQPSLVDEAQPRYQRQTAAQARDSFLSSTVGTVVTGVLRTLVQGLLAAAVVARDRSETPANQDSTDLASTDTVTE